MDDIFEPCRWCVGEINPEASWPEGWIWRRCLHPGNLARTHHCAINRDNVDKAARHWPFGASCKKNGHSVCTWFESARILNRLPGRP